MSDKKLLLIVLLILSFITNAFSQPAQNKISLSQKSNDFIEGKTIISEIEYTGLNSDYDEYDDVFSLSDFLKHLRENRANISAGEIFNSRKIENVLIVLKKWLANKGYLKADVVAFGEKLPKDRMKLVFSVSRGVSVGVSEITFAGNVNISNEEYVADFKQCLGDFWKKYDVRTYNYITQKCSRYLMYSKGYFQGTILRVNRRFVGTDYVVTVTVNEGERFRIGEIKIDGAKIFSEKELLEMFEQQQGDIADGVIIQKFFYEKLKEEYTNRGYVEFNAEFDVEFIKPQAEGLDGTINIKGIIEEGGQFKLGKIEFVGIEKEKANELRKLFLENGEIYDQSKIKQAIDKINNLKEFYPIDIDSSSVEIKTNQEDKPTKISPILGKENIVLEQRNNDNQIIKPQYSDKVYLTVRLRKLEQ